MEMKKPIPLSGLFFVEMVGCWTVVSSNLDQSVPFVLGLTHPRSAGFLPACLAVKCSLKSEYEVQGL